MAAALTGKLRRPDALSAGEVNAHNAERDAWKIPFYVGLERTGFCAGLGRADGLGIQF